MHIRYNQLFVNIASSESNSLLCAYNKDVRGYLPTECFMIYHTWTQNKDVCAYNLLHYVAHYQ